MDDSDIIVVIVFVALFFVLGIVLGYTMNESEWKTKAIEHKAAHYVLDEKSGHSTFEWNNK